MLFKEDDENGLWFGLRILFCWTTAVYHSYIWLKSTPWCPRSLSLFLCLLSSAAVKHGFAHVTKERSEVAFSVVSLFPSGNRKSLCLEWTSELRPSRTDTGSLSPMGAHLPEAARHSLCSDVLSPAPFQLSQGSPEPIEPNFFTSDYHLLRHSLAANNWSQSDPTGKRGPASTKGNSRENHFVPTA